MACEDFIATLRFKDGLIVDGQHKCHDTFIFENQLTTKMEQLNIIILITSYTFDMQEF